MPHYYEMRLAPRNINRIADDVRAQNLSSICEHARRQEEKQAILFSFLGLCHT